MVGINTSRDDGRIEVIRDGYVVWCGRDEKTAETIATNLRRNSEGRVAGRRDRADIGLLRAITSKSAP